MFTQAEFTQLASDLGRTATLRTVSQATYDPATDSYSTDTTSDASVTAVFQNTLSQRTQGGTLVTQKGVTAFIAAEGLAAAPTTKDKLVDGSDTYQVLSVTTHKPGGTVIAYLLELS